MQLTDDEKRVLDGEEGPARAAAMKLLTRYGTALGAERLVDTNNVAGGVVGTLPNRRNFVDDPSNFDAVFSLMNLDADEVYEIPPVKANAYKLIEALDPDHWERQGVSPEVRKLVEQNEAFCNRIGVNRCNTCTPYQVGNVPIFGEHLAWMESSAVIYANSLLGARTNVEGAQSAGAAMLVGKIPYWGMHVPESRFANYHIAVDFDVDDMMDWGLLGYWMGEVVKDQIPVLTGLNRTGELRKLKHFGAAAATSGGVEMYHIVGKTPEAPTFEAATNGRTPEHTLRFGHAERRQAYENLNCADDPNIDFIMLGCPHNSLDQVRLIARLLEGRKVSKNTDLWIFTPSALRSQADRMGYTEIIEQAGAFLMSDTCPALGRVQPEDVKVVATDSCKQAHYLPATHGWQTWFGTVEECIDSACHGRWTGGLQ